MSENGMKSHHQFILSNHDGVVIRCCVHCGLSHLLGHNQQGYYPCWALIQEENEDVTFAEPCPSESGSDASFPHHHFILSHHQGRVIRFCVRCGLSHVWTTNPQKSALGQHWRLIRENERDVTISEPCLVEPETDAFRQRYEHVPMH